MIRYKLSTDKNIKMYGLLYTISEACLQIAQPLITFLFVSSAYR